MADDALPETLGEGRYAVIGLLAEGSQGATLDAVDKHEGQPVAIKRFQVKGARSWKDVELAEREAEVLGKLSHRLLPAYIDHFEQDGALYLVMEKIEGESLRTRLQRDKQLPPEQVVRFLHDAAEVLDYLHDRPVPVIHRDVKPANVIRRPDGSFVLVDFGSVRAELKPKGGSTVVGTFGYMAPEQLQGRALPGTDVYGVGVTALALLTGAEPEDLPHKGLSIDVAAALSERVRVAPAFVEVLRAMVQPDPDKRASRIGPLLEKLPADVASPGSTKAPPKRAAKPEASREAGRRPPDVAKTADSERKKTKDDAGRWRPSPMPRPQPVRTRRPYARPEHQLPPIIALIALIALSVARIAVAMSLRVAVPVALTLLSLVFGKPLREAARSVRLAGRRAGQGLAEAQHRIRPTGSRHRRPSVRPRRGRGRYRSGAGERPAARGVAGAETGSGKATKPRSQRKQASTGRKRVAEPADGGRPRRGRIDGAQQDAEQADELREAFAEMEEAMREVDDGLSRKRRRGKED